MTAIHCGATLFLLVIDVVVIVVQKWLLRLQSVSLHVDTAVPCWYGSSPLVCEEVEQDVRRT